jgi:hypothetical protein
LANTERLTPPDAVSYVCKFENLKSLEMLARLTALPSCIGHKLGSLFRLDVRGNEFGYGSSNVPILPASLEKLTNMVDFVGFGQSAQRCPPGGDPVLPPAAALAAGKDAVGDGAAPWRLKCRPNFWYIATHMVNLDAEDDDPDLPWQCPDRSWKVKFDDASAPWWKWRKLEKFWVDANFFHGSIPDFIAGKWPRLRTIDLYNNELTGTIPPSLGRLTDLTQIQLQDNDLEGTVPNEVLYLPKLIKMRVAKNAGLSGDIMTDEMAKSKAGTTTMWLNHQYNGIRLCSGSGLNCTYPVGYSRDPAAGRLTGLSGDESGGGSGEGSEVTASFHNLLSDDHARTLDPYGLDDGGDKVLIGTLKAGETQRLDTQHSHRFIAVAVPSTVMGEQAADQGSADAAQVHFEVQVDRDLHDANQELQLTSFHNDGSLTYLHAPDLLPQLHTTTPTYALLLRDTRIQVYRK